MILRKKLQKSPYLYYTCRILLTYHLIDYKVINSLLNASFSLKITWVVILFSWGDIWGKLPRMSFSDIAMCSKTTLQDCIPMLPPPCSPSWIPPVGKPSLFSSDFYLELYALMSAPLADWTSPRTIYVWFSPVSGQQYTMHVLRLKTYLLKELCIFEASCQAVYPEAWILVPVWSSLQNAFNMLFFHFWICYLLSKTRRLDNMVPEQTSKL